MNDEPEYAELEEVPCPQCGEAGHLEIQMLMAAAVPPLVSLSGMQMKLAGTRAPHLVCGACGFKERGKLK